MRDWRGDAGFIVYGNNRKQDSAENDYYATEPKATELILRRERFSQRIWEPTCGEGHIAKVLTANGYEVTSTDLIDRGFGKGNVDFLHSVQPYQLGSSFDIITNPPYSQAQEFCEHAIDLINDGCKVAMFLKLTFLEGKKRRALFEKHPPQTVYVFSSRVCCGKNGTFDPSRNAVAYAWFIWEKGFKGAPQIKWIDEV